MEILHFETKNYLYASMLVSRGGDSKLGTANDLGVNQEVACGWYMHHRVMCIRSHLGERILVPLPQDMREGIDIDS
jgi:hypothetical protein